MRDTAFRSDCSVVVLVVFIVLNVLSLVCVSVRWNLPSLSRAHGSCGGLPFSRARLRKRESETRSKRGRLRPPLPLHLHLSIPSISLSLQPTPSLPSLPFSPLPPLTTSFEARASIPRATAQHGHVRSQLHAPRHCVACCRHKVSHYTYSRNSIRFNSFFSLLCACDLPLLPLPYLASGACTPFFVSLALRLSRYPHTFPFALLALSFRQLFSHLLSIKVLSCLKPALVLQSFCTFFSSVWGSPPTSIFLLQARALTLRFR